MEVQPGLVLKGKWTLTNYLAKGACAEIWAVSCDDATARLEKRDKKTGWIAKIVPEPAFLTAAAKKKVRKATDVQLNAQALNWERTLYRSILRGHDSIPKGPLRDDYGTQDDIRFLIMERLGENLGDYFISQNRKFSNATIANYGKQMLSALRECHERKVLFIDVKPENFMLGYNDPNKLYIADFGVAKKYIDSKGLIQGIPGGSGTPCYMSLRCQDKGIVSRRDDLESLAYLLIELLVGQLPWADAKSEKELISTKQSTDIEALCSPFPAGGHLWEFCKFTRAMDFEDTPDYATLERLLSAVASCPDTSSSSSSSSKKNSKVQTTAPPKTKKKDTKKLKQAEVATEKEAVEEEDEEVVEVKTARRGRRKTPLKETDEDNANPPVKEPEIKKSKTVAKTSKKKKVVEVIEVEDNEEDEHVDVPRSRMKENKRTSLKRQSKKASKDEESHATASASATVTYTYTAPKRKTRRVIDHDGDDEEDDDDGDEPTSYTATVTVTATAKASHPIPTL
jgi:serine/threonine protein kinase